MATCLSICACPFLSHCRLQKKKKKKKRSRRRYDSDGDSMENDSSSGGSDEESCSDGDSSSDAIGSPVVSEYDDVSDSTCGSSDSDY